MELTTGQIIALIVLILFLMTAAASVPTYYAITRNIEISELQNELSEISELQNELSECQNNPNRLMGMYSYNIGTPDPVYINIININKTNKDPEFQSLLKRLIRNAYYDDGKIKDDELHSYFESNYFYPILQILSSNYEVHITVLLEKKSNTEYISINDNNINEIKLEDDGNIYIIWSSKDKTLLTPVDISSLPIIKISKD